MERPYVDWVRIENYRCVKSVDLHLTPLHALIGPNDSGKSSILRAIAGDDATLWVQGFGAHRGRANWSSAAYPSWSGNSPPSSIQKIIADACRPRTTLRLDPDSIRQPVHLIQQDHPLWFQDEKGLGTPALYDALLSRDIVAFGSLNDRFRALFSTVRSIRLHNTSPVQKQLGITLLDGTEVGPDGMSEGMLYWLAFAILEHLVPQGILLVEEPENGLHPARIAEVMSVLREISTRTQVILATHSPLVINELAPEEVTIVTRTPERGSICTPMTATKHFEDRSKVYALGELWLSFADGKLESELVGDDPGVARAG